MTPKLILRLNKTREPITFPAPENAAGFFQIRETDAGPELTRWINNALNCDYMGAAEFEYGAVPKALWAMTNAAKAGELVETELTFSGTPSIAFALKGKPEAEALALPTETKTWLLCPKAILEELKPYLEELTQNDSPTTFRTLEVPYIKKGLFGFIRGYQNHIHADSNYIGWLDIKNLWFLTKDEAQMRALKTLFALP